MKKIYKLYVYSTTYELYFTSKKVANRVRRLLEDDGESVEMNEIIVDPKFFNYPSTNKEAKVPYVINGKLKTNKGIKNG